MLFLFVFNVPLAEFASLLWVVVLHEYESLTRKSCSKWDYAMLQHAVIASLIQFAFTWCKSPTLKVAKASRTMTKLPPCFMVGVIQGVAALSPTLHCTQTLLFDPKILNFELWFFSPKDFIPLFYCLVFVHLGPLEPFDIVLLPQQWFLSNSTPWASFTESSLYSRCWCIFS